MNEYDLPLAGPPCLGTQTAALAGELAARHFPHGDLAALRRMDGARADVPAFWRLATRHRLLGDCAPDEDRENHWALIVSGLARGTRTDHRTEVSAHDRNTPLGRALFEEGFSEQRLSRLLAAHGDMLGPIAERCTRFLAAKARPFDWLDLASLILCEGTAPASAESTRRDIARAYYAAEAREKAAGTPSEQS